MNKKDTNTKPKAKRKAAISKAVRIVSALAESKKGRWSGAETLLLRKLLKTKTPIHKISKSLRRSKDSIYAKAHSMGLK